MRIRFSKSCAPLIIAVLSAALMSAASAHDLVCHVTLDGPNENPSNNSPATGSGTVTVDFDLFTMRVEVNFAGLQGTVTAAHIHATTPSPFSGIADVATQTPSFAAFPFGVTSGNYDHTFDLTDASSYNPDFVAANGGTISTASNALFAAFVQGRAYLDIHTSAFPDGEIRGFLVPPKIVITDISAARASEQTLVAIEGTVEPAGAGVLLEKSTDLQNWGSGIVGDSDPDNGVFSFATTESPSTTKQFYRVIDLLEPNRAP